MAWWNVDLPVRHRLQVIADGVDMPVGHESHRRLDYRPGVFAEISKASLSVFALVQDDPLRDVYLGCKGWKGDGRCHKRSSGHSPIFALAQVRHGSRDEL